MVGRLAAYVMASSEWYCISTIASNRGQAEKACLTAMFGNWRKPYISSGWGQFAEQVATYRAVFEHVDGDEETTTGRLDSVIKGCVHGPLLAGAV